MLFVMQLVNIKKLFFNVIEIRFHSDLQFKKECTSDGNGQIIK